MAANKSTTSAAAARALILQYAELTRQLFQGIQTVTETGVRSATPMVTLNAIIALDKQLQLALQELEEHQRFQQKIDAVRQQIAMEDAKIVQLAQLLQRAEQALDETVADAETRLKQIEKSQQAVVSVEDLVAYARKISYNTSAPPDWDEKRAMAPYMPPAPDDVMIKSSLLFEVAEGTVPVDGERPNVTTATPSEISTSIEMDASSSSTQHHPAVANPLLDLDLN